MYELQKMEDLLDKAGVALNKAVDSAAAAAASKTLAALESAKPRADVSGKADPFKDLVDCYDEPVVSPPPGGLYLTIEEAVTKQGVKDVTLHQFRRDFGVPKLGEPVYSWAFDSYKVVQAHQSALACYLDGLMVARAEKDLKGAETPSPASTTRALEEVRCVHCPGTVVQVKRQWGKAGDIEYESMGFVAEN